jgi:hypothetical protein
MQSITKMQIQTMDHMMDAWEEQIKSPNPMTGSPSAMLSKLSLPSVSPAGSWPNADAFPMAAMNPLHLWLQLAEQWQKAWADAMTFWLKAGNRSGQGCPAWNVSQFETCPDLSPVMNQRVRCSDEPWVKPSGTT